MTEALLLLPHLRKSSAQAAVVVAPMPWDRSEFLIAMVATVAQARQAASVDQASPTQVAVVADTAMHPAQPHIPEELAEVVAVALALGMDLMPFQAQQIRVAEAAAMHRRQA
jgi:urease gamma subunit